MNNTHIAMKSILRILLAKLNLYAFRTKIIMLNTATAANAKFFQFSFMIMRNWQEQIYYLQKAPEIRLIESTDG